MHPRLAPHSIVLAMLCMLFVLGELSLPCRATATHETDHRFTVHGTVRDGRSFPGKPLAEQEVVIRDSKTGEELQRGKTDKKGQFSLVLHLHSEDRGRRLSLQCLGSEKAFDVQFDPDNHTAERQAKVDLVVQPK